MKIRIELLHHAREVAKKSPFEKHRVGAIIADKRGKIVSRGVNSHRTHPKQAKHAREANDEERVFLHAEMAALVRQRESAETIYVSRITKTGLIGLAKPCPICTLALLESELSYVVYSTGDDNEIGVLDLDCMRLDRNKNP